jgi:hypothetical protein
VLALLARLFRYPSFPISVQWGEQAQMRFNDRQFVIFGDAVTPIFAVDLELGETQPDGSVPIRMISESVASEYRFRVGEHLPGGYQHEHCSGPGVKFRVGMEGGIDLVEYLQRDPFIIRYVDGTYSYNCYHVPAKLAAGLYDRAKLESWDWSGVPLNKESIRKCGDKATIQYRTFEHLEPEYDLVFNDDGCGEAADLICIKDADNGSIQLCFVHCKGAHGGHISQDIRNFYTVCGQAQKSIVAKHAGLPSLYHDLRRRQENWIQDGASRFLKGDMKKLAYFKERARRCKVTFETVLVQPGASIKTITDAALRLLATTEMYLLKTTEARFRVVLSE